MSPATLSHAPKPAAVAVKKKFVPLSDKLTRGLQDVTKTIEDNKATLDTIQELGIELSQTINALAASALKYANMVNNILDSVMPMISTLPFIPKQTQEFLANLNEFADKFIASCQSAQKISGGVENGLVAGDMTSLKAHSAELQKVAVSVRNLLPDKK